MPRERRRSGTDLRGLTTRALLNTFGGTTAASVNVISGNNEGGIKSTGSITIEWNDIGTDATGNVALGNGDRGGGNFGLGISFQCG